MSQARWNNFTRSRALLFSVARYCSRCGAKGERFSYRKGVWVKEKWGNVFRCPHCGYEANADHNASVNMHHSFYREWHWQPKKKPPPSSVPRGEGRGNALSGH